METIFDNNWFIQEKSLDLELDKSLHEMKSVLSKGVITILESVTYDEKPELVCEATFEQIKEAGLKLFKKVLDALVEFFKQLYVQIQVKVEQIKLNKKLEELKDQMAKKRSRLTNRHYDYFDVQKYKRFYTEFINKYTSELIKGMNKDFKNVKEYETWRTSMLNKLSDFQFKLTDEEQWKLSVSINSAVHLSEEASNNRIRTLQMVHNEGSASIKQLEGYYKRINPEKSFVNLDKGKITIFSMHNSFLGLVCSKIAQLIRTVAKIITKHTFLCVTALLVVLIAV